MNVFILGLRRSGTTIFWETLRQDKRFIAYDEPFNPLLVDLPLQNRKQTRDELIKVYQKDPVAFQQNFAPIPLEEEFQPGLTEAQANYLKWLLQHSDKPKIIDFTRCTFKIEALHQVDPDAVLVHLHREAGAFATSHLIPSRSRQKLPLHVHLRDWYRRASFFTRQGDFNAYGYETLYSLHDGDLWSLKKSAAALEKLLVISKTSSEVVTRDGLDKFQSRFVSICFEEFTANPLECVEKIMALTSIDISNLNFESVRRASLRYLNDSSRWDNLYGY
jgi:hypothetical protein